MNIAQPVSTARHPYADGSYKKMLIDGKWVDAASGKRFETHNPATGELLATVAEGDAEDINRAVAAARRAFEGPWSKVKPFERQNLLLKLADLVEQNFEELSRSTRSIWARRSAAPAATSCACSGCSATMPASHLAARRDYPELAARRYFLLHLKEPVGVVGAIIPWNGPLGAAFGRSALRLRPAAR